MKFPFKTLGLLLASLAVASCGGGGGNGGAASAPAIGTITLTATKVNLPLNPNGILPYPGSPFTAEVKFTYRNNTGQITALTSDATFTINQPSVSLHFSAGRSRDAQTSTNCSSASYHSSTRRTTARTRCS